MTRISGIVLGILLVLCMTAQPAAARYTQTTVNVPGMGSISANSLGNGSVSVPWGQNNININQLQSLFAQNPNFSQFQIQFPNGLNWDVSPQGIQSLYSNFQQQAQKLGYSTMPDLSFSSIANAVPGAGAVTIPIQNAVSGMQQQADNALRDLHNQGTSFFNSLPSWLQTMLQMIADGFSILYDFARDTVTSLFR